MRPRPLALLILLYVAPKSSSFIPSQIVSESLARSTRSHKRHGVVSLASRETVVEYAESTESVASNLPFWLDNIFHSSEFWSCTVMLSIVALLFAWEEGIKRIREGLSETLVPVVDSMLAELSGLGAVGLFLSVVVTDGPLGEVVGGLSEHWLGDEEILLETFEFLHTAFFEVGISFFLVAGLTVAKVVGRVDSLETVSRAVFDLNGDGEVCLDDLADALKVEMVVVDLDGDGILTDEEVKIALRNTPKPSMWDELVYTTSEVQAEALVVRERFLRTCRVDKSFRIETYFRGIFARNLQEMVELSPLTWLPLIPALSLGNSVDVSRDVVSAASPNAAASCGWFLGTPAFVGSVAAVSALALAWGAWNFYKVTSIKTMLVPTLVRDAASTGGTATLLPPRYEDEKLLHEFNSSPGIIAPIEKLFCKEPPRNEHEELFGAAGASFPEIYRNSIKLHTWFVVSQVVLWGGQIVARDAEALALGWTNVGNPELVLPELLVFSGFVAVAVAQLFWAPSTFLNFSLVTSIEDLANEYSDCISEACSLDGDVYIDRSKDSEPGEILSAPSTWVAK